MTRSLTVWREGTIVGSLAPDGNAAVGFAYGRPMPALRPLGGPLLVTGLVTVSALTSVPALQDAATHQPFPPATLHQPFGYLLGAPLFGLFDSVSLLTLRQHYALVVTLILLYVAYRLVAALVARRSDRPRPLPRPSLPRRAAREALFAVATLAALLAFYAAAALLGRPMVGLDLTDPDLLAVDFHSHTNHSHDGWSRFTAARNRAWHEVGGFGAAYITDHYTWAGVDDALPANPARAGDRTVLLSGMEVRLRDRHTNILGDRNRYVFALDSAWHHLDPDSIAAARDRGAAPATMLYTIPGALDQIVPLAPGSPRAWSAWSSATGRPVALNRPRASAAKSWLSPTRWTSPSSRARTCTAGAVRSRRGA